jgi:hypothetical protein
MKKHRQNTNEYNLEYEMTEQKKEAVGSPLRLR